MEFKHPMPGFGLVWRIAGGALAGTILLTSFQNCGKAGFDAQTDEGVLSSASTSTSSDQSLITKYGQLNAPKVQAVPFAFDVEMDQITYNSCFGASYQKKPGAFNFKFGSYNAVGGLKVKQTFHDYVQNTFKPTYPSTVITNAEKKAYLYDSPKNKNVTLQFAWRNFAQPYWVRNTKNAKPGVDYTDYGLSATDDRVLDSLFKKPTGSNFFGMAPEISQRQLEYSIYFGTTESFGEWFRRDMSLAGNDGQRGLLAMTFKKEGGEAFAPASPVENDTKVAYGRGFSFIFGKFGAVPALNNPENILMGVNEVNLETTTKAPVAGTWTCPSTLRLVIVRPKDAALTCPAPSMASLANTATRERLKIIRRHLPASQWEVNVELSCAVPKGFDCYSQDTINNALVPVEYNPSKECHEDIDNKTYTSTDPVPVCAQYISVCTK